MFIIGDVEGGVGSLSTARDSSLLSTAASSFSWRDDLLLISINSFLIVSTCELHNVDDLGRLISILRLLAVSSLSGDWLNRPSNLKACLEGVTSFTWKNNPKRHILIWCFREIIWKWLTHYVCTVRCSWCCSWCSSSFVLIVFPLQKLIEWVGQRALGFLKHGARSPIEIVTKKLTSV